MLKKKCAMLWTVLLILALSLSIQGCTKKSGGAGSDGITLSYWVDLGAVAASVMSNYNESEMYQRMQELTGIRIDFKHPPAGQATEQFNLLIASRDLPDLIEYNWGSGYPGGAEKAIGDNVIISLNDLVDSHAPNYKAILDSDGTISRQARTDSGLLFCFPAVGVDSLKVSGGPMIRKDWLDRVGLGVPETIDEWTGALRAFRDQLGAQAPLTGSVANFSAHEAFAGVFGVGAKFYLDGGVVKYGPMEEGYRQYVLKLKQWYEEKLLDQDFLANDAKTIDAMVTTGKSGALHSYIGGGLGKYMNSMKEKEPAFELVAAQYPVLRKGDQPRFLLRAWEIRNEGMLAVASSNRHPEESAKWADYFYGDEGNLLKNFGVEGRTYQMVDGYPTYTELILKNPDGLSIGQAISKYTRAATPAPGTIDKRYHEQYYDLQQQKDAMNLWNGVADNALEVMLPQVTPTAEEAEELSVIISTVNAYVDEMFVKFILGTEPMEKYGAFLEQIKAMNIDRAIKINQDALERYQKREAKTN